MHGLVGPSKPLLPVSELTLIYLASHLAKTVSYDTVKLYLVAVQDLHRELNFPLHINKMHRLQKVLTGIKRLAPSTKRDRFPITTQILSAIHNYLCPALGTNLDHKLLYFGQPSHSLSLPSYVLVSSLVMAPSTPRSTSPPKI